MKELRECFSEPIGSIYYAAILLTKAIEMHHLGDFNAAKRLIKAADMPEIGSWLDPIWLRKSPLVQPVKLCNQKAVIPKSERTEPRMPNVKMKRDLILRDGHHCRFCRMPVIRAEVRKEINKLYPKEARWTSLKEIDQHRGLQVMWLQYDHIEVHSRGGETSLDNLVITCVACNFGRDRFSIEEMRFLDPRTHVRRADWFGCVKWDGLESILPKEKRVLQDVNSSFRP